MWHFIQRAPPDPADMLRQLEHTAKRREEEAVQKKKPLSARAPAQLPSSSARPRTAVPKVKIDSLPSISSKDPRHKDPNQHKELLRRRKAELMEQAAKIQMMLDRRPESAAPEDPASPVRPRTQQQPGRPSTQERREAAMKERIAKGKAPFGQIMPTWQVPSANDLPTFKSPGVQISMTYLKIDGNGLVPNAKPFSGKM